MTTPATVHPDVRAAWRQRLLTLALAATGALTNVSVAGSTYSRAAGSFLTDGFMPGDEIVASGFATPANNGRAVVVAVTALTLVVDRTLAVEAAGASIEIKAGLPLGRAWEGGPAYTPQIGVPYLREKVLAVSDTVRSIGGMTQEHLLSCEVVFCYPNGKGTLAVERMAGACLGLFKPSTALVYGGSKSVVIRSQRKSLVENPDWLDAPVSITATAFSTQ